MLIPETGMPAWPACACLCLPLPAFAVLQEFQPTTQRIFWTVSCLGIRRSDFCECTKAWLADVSCCRCFRYCPKHRARPKGAEFTELLDDLWMWKACCAAAFSFLSHVPKADRDFTLSGIVDLVGTASRPRQARQASEWV